MSHAANGMDFAEYPFVSSYGCIVAACATKVAAEIVLVFHVVFYNHFIAT